MAELRKKIVKLCKMVGGLTGMMNKIDENAPEYYALECVVSDEQADVALKMGLRKPRTVKELAARCGKSEEYVRKIAMELAQIGVCKVYTENGEDVFLVQIFAPGILEMMVNNKKQCEEHPQIARAFEEYTRIRIAAVAPVLPMGTGMMRVIPVQKAIDGNPHKVDIEEIEYYLNKYDIFSVADCSCRRSRRIMGEGCGHLETEMCVQMGSGAEYYIRTGRARQITREEAREIILKAEENGLMHQMPNIEGEGETAAICNCCSCSCFAMRVATMFKAPEAIASNYYAEADKEKCVACGQCVETCPTNALRLGQKLCAKVPVEDKPEKKITENVWRKSDWNPDYRINRTDVSESGTAPCKTKCPAHIAIQGYIKLAAQGKYTEALELIKKENPFPAVCGRICPRGCESECTRGDIDEPIAIDEIKKFIADRDMDEKLRYVPKKMHDYRIPVAIIGAGPAGLSCAYYLAIDGYDVTVFEKEKILGGMMTLGIPSFRLGREVVNAEIDVLRQLGVKFETGVEVGKDVTIPELRERGFKAFYIAIGAQGGRKLNVEGEDAKGVIAGVQFLKDVNLGLQTAEIKGKVIVIGGGNVAIDVARTAVRLNPESVNMYCLESREEMPAHEEEICEAEEENVVVNNGYGVKKIIAENGIVKGVEFMKCVSVFDKDGRFAPVYDENDVTVAEADTVILSIGQSIVWGDLLKDSKVTLNRNGTVIADDFTYQTAQEDIFAGGDVYTGPLFAINAIAAGKQGAISIHRYVQPGQSLVLGRDRRDYVAFDKDNVIVQGFDNTPRQQAGHTDRKRKTFEDDRLTFTEEQLKKETERCLGCGAVNVNTYMCVGCGLCTTRCKFDAIHLVRKEKDNFAGKFETLPLKVAPYALKRAGKIVKHAVKKAFGQDKE